MPETGHVNGTNLSAAAEASSGEGSPRGSVHWDDSKMQTQFANVVNIQSTREQVDLFFGTNQTWNVPNEKKITVELSNRIILTPYAAKRLLTILQGVLREYEARHGPLNVDR